MMISGPDASATAQRVPEVPDQLLAIPAAARAVPKEIIMLYTIAVVLIILWALGLVSSYTMGGFIHILLVIAIIVILLNVIGGRRTG